LGCLQAIRRARVRLILEFSLVSKSDRFAGFLLAAGSPRSFCSSIRRRKCLVERRCGDASIGNAPGFHRLLTQKSPFAKVNGKRAKEGRSELTSSSFRFSSL